MENTRAISNAPTQTDDFQEGGEGVSMAPPTLNLQASTAAGDNPGEGPIQRAIEPFQETADADQPEVKGFVGRLDGVMQAVWAQLISRRLKPAEKGIDGYTERWDKLLGIYLAHPTPDNAALMPAAFGYVMESVVCKMRMPGIGAGLSIHLQETNGNTRPDVVLKKGETDVAWLDLTASESKGHILKKSGGGWSSRPHVYEITYPSISAEMIKGMIDKNPGGADLSLDDVEKEYYLKKAKENYMLRVTKALLRMALSGLDAKKSSMSDTKTREEAREEVKLLLGISVTPKDTANVLTCLDKDAKYYGFRKSAGRFGGYASMFSGLSAVAGEALCLKGSSEPSEQNVMDELQTLNPGIHAEILKSKAPAAAVPG